MKPILNSREKSVVLVSGGMDSVTALYHAVEALDVVACISFDYGSKHNACELPFAASHCQGLGIRHDVILLNFINDLFRSDLLQSGGEIPEGHYEEQTMQQTVVPFRNGIMLSIAAGYAESVGASALVIAAHSGDHAIYPDCRESFMSSMAEAVRQGTYANISLLRPFIEFTKSQIAARGIELGVDFSRTWSCYKGDSIHCGKCGTCVERREAFILAGITDPTPYEAMPPIPPKPGS